MPGIYIDRDATLQFADLLASTVRFRSLRV
jgi:hypothetical protein